MYYLIIFLCTNACLATALNCLCEKSENDCKLGSKTPYRFIQNLDDREIVYPGCKSEKIWMLVRHGTRYPGKKWMSSLITQIPQIKKDILLARKAKSLKDDYYNLLSNWTLGFSETDIMNLAVEGEHELIDFAERYQARFPHLYPEVFSNETYKFKYTNTQRTRESAKHFAIGLFGLEGSKRVYFPPPEDKDPILRFYKRCKRWKVEVDKNPEAYKERDEFIKSDLVQKMVKQVSEKVGVDLNFPKINLMKMQCAFETAIFRNSSWCQLFTDEHFDILEYVDDLEYYWIDGYGVSLTYNIACPATTDMFEFFAKKDGPKVNTYFSHSGTLLKVLSLLGIAKDPTPLTASTYGFHKNRAWKTSYIDAFATNIAFVLFNCESNGPSILTLHQERPVWLPGCPENRPCPLSTMKELYPDSDEECKFDSLCTECKKS